MSILYIKLESVEIENAHETIRPGSPFGSEKPGAMVAVRPCDAECKGKTYLGMYLCSAPTGVIGKQVGEKLILSMTDYTNPAIYVPDLNRIVWGYGSWWRLIRSQELLMQITDADIESVWYVRALKQIETLATK